jgi:rSAM/selenodomain-associated transferase 1
MTTKSLLIIFYRNPELGKVKTRLARTVGDEKALAIYLKLSSYTRQITQQLSIDKQVYYSEFADTEDHWPNSSYQKKIQHGNDLGDRMNNAFASAFAVGYKSVCIIGTDCIELTSSMITFAFEQLRTHDAVVGPAVDGGYYLLGMNHLHSEVFKNKSWSQSTVCVDTILDFDNLKLKYSKLEILSDIDEESDLLKSRKLL